MPAETIYSMARKIISLTIPENSAFTHVLFNLAAQGYSYIKISYSGGGDSGSIDGISLVERGCLKEDEDGEPIPVEGVKMITADPDHNLKNLLEKKAYDNILLDANDWWNSEGGGGTLFIATEDAKYYGDHYINVVKEEHEILSGKFGDN